MSQEQVDDSPSWYIVLSQGRVVLGVYGSSLLSMAQEKARQIERKTGLSTFVESVSGKRPSVGEVR